MCLGITHLAISCASGTGCSQLIFNDSFLTQPVEVVLEVLQGMLSLRFRVHIKRLIIVLGEQVDVDNVDTRHSTKYAYVLAFVYVWFSVSADLQALSPVVIGLLQVEYILLS